MHDRDQLKAVAAQRAVELVRPGMKLGLGTGSTAKLFVDLLGERVREGLSVIGVPTSQKTFDQAKALDIPLASLDDYPELDLTVDGADELDSELQLIKGGGGALLREKIVAHASRRMIVIADETKLVERLGAFPLPVEVAPFGLSATREQIRRGAAKLGLFGALNLRGGAAAPFVTDGGHNILDCAFGAIPQASELAALLDEIPGVMGHGLFLHMASGAILAGSQGLRIIGDLD